MHVNMVHLSRHFTEYGPRSRTIGMYSCFVCTGPEEYFNVELKTIGAFLSYILIQNR